MSLVITSNEIQRSAGGGSNYQKAFTWSNHLNQPLVLPKNCEVAVQSLKVNKDGTISVSPATNFYVYYGVKLSDTVSYDDVSSIAMEVDLGVASPTDVSVEELADKVKDALNRGVPNPETFGLSDCTVKRNADGTEFLGFVLKFESRTNGSALDNKPQEWFNPWKDSPSNVGNAGLIFNSASNTLVPNYLYADRETNQYFSMATAGDTPIALNGGQFTVDVSKATGCGWGVGLRRATAGQPFPDISEYDSDTDYQNYFVDFAIYSEQNKLGTGNFFLKAYASVYASTYNTTTIPLYTGETEYYNASASGDFNTGSKYNYSTNASNITKIRFEVDNEKVKVIAIDNKSAEFTLVDVTGDYKLLDTSGSQNEMRTLRFPPVRDSCRNLYPFVFLTPNAGNNSVLTIDKWSGRQITGFKYNDISNDYYCRAVAIDKEQQLINSIETRPGLNVGFTQEPPIQPTYKGTNASGVMDYDYVLVMDYDSDLYTNTINANGGNLLGFENAVVLDTAVKSGDNDEISEYTSSSAPELKSTTSLFVRLNNLPVKSYNAGQSRRSQIIYSAPRFASGTDQSVGALFFESPEKTYISIDNPQPINLNTVDIDIVNENETLATDLLGKTVCTLHFREKKL